MAMRSQTSVRDGSTRPLSLRGSLRGCAALSLIATGLLSAEVKGGYRDFSPNPAVHQIALSDDQRAASDDATVHQAIELSGGFTSAIDAVPGQKQVATAMASPIKPLLIPVPTARESGIAGLVAVALLCRFRPLLRRVLF